MSSSSSRKSSKKKSSNLDNGKSKRERKEDDAARTIQLNWRKHRTEKMKKEVVEFSSNFHVVFIFNS